MSTRRHFIGQSGAGLLSALLPLSTFSQMQEEASAHVEPGFEGLIVTDDEGEAVRMRDGSAIVKIKVARSSGAASIAALSEVFHPGDTLPVHKHLNEDEVIFIHKGKGLFTLGEKQYPLGEGSIVFIPKGVWHGFHNNGSEPIDMRFCYSPPGFEGFFREVGTAVGQPFVQKTMEERRAIAKKWGMIYK